MNERIKELFDQAANYAMKNTKCHIDHEREEWQKDVDNLLKEKFAELIVRECAKTIESQDVDPSFKNRMSWAIKTKFGIES